MTLYVDKDGCRAAMLGYQNRPPGGASLGNDVRGLPLYLNDRLRDRLEQHVTPKGTGCSPRRKSSLCPFFVGQWRVTSGFGVGVYSEPSSDAE
jgi:hypothetical protein